MIDLHTHSRFSDGSDSPAELAEMAHDLGISAIALTDHDTTASYDEMSAACAQRGVELVAGVEISLRDGEFPRINPDGSEGPRNVHVLAYFVPQDPSSPVQRQLAQLRRDRDARNRRLVTLLQELGFERITFDHLVTLAHNEESIGRPHFAEAMFSLHPEIVGERSPENWGRLFNEWLGNGGRAYIPKTAMTITEFVDAAAGSGTVFSIAHPHLNYLDRVATDTVGAAMPAVIGSLRERGFSGIEAYYGSSPKEVRALMVKLTRDAGMIPTGGSDYHGLFKADVSLGRGLSGDLVVPDGVLDELKSASRERTSSVR